MVPNSRQLPFLPGEHLVEPATQASRDVLQRRYNRHTGKHNCLYSPQYFLEATSHWPFIRRVSAVPSSNLSYQAFQPLTEGWNCSPWNASEGVWEPLLVQGLKAIMSLYEIRLHCL
jgi:hypothetical protein